MNLGRIQKYRTGLIGSLLATLLMVSGVYPVCVSGFVTDAAGNPVANADLDFFVAATGVKLVTPGDNTDALGFFNVCVLPGVYNMTFAPPSGTHLMGGRLDNIDLSANVSLDTSVVLDAGVVISGTVTDSLGVPIGDIDLDLDELLVGRVFTPNDNTDTLSGAYWVVVPSGTYRIQYDTPLGTRYRGLQLDSVTVRTDTIIDIALAEGLLLSGRVSDQAGQGLFDVVIDLREEGSGDKVFISNNDTDTSGAYQVAVPAGLFQLRFSPPLGSNLVGAIIDSLSLSSDLVWDQTLSTGVVFTVTVTDSIGTPIAGADLDLKLTSTGEKIFTPHDKTDALGTASVAVPPDIYMIQLDPPLGSLFDRVIIDSVAIQNDTAIVMIMPEVPRVNLSGRVTNTLGVGLAEAHIDLRTSSTGTKVFLVDNITDSSGYFNVAAPIGNLDLLLLPPRGSRYVGRIIENINISADTVTEDLVLTEGVLVTVAVEDEFGEAITGVDLDFTSEISSVEIYTPFDNTDEAGIAVVAVPIGRYLLELTPLPASAFVPLVLSGVEITADTTLTVTMTRKVGSGAESVGYLRQNFPNPFNSETHIRYTVPTGGRVSITVFNVLGQTVQVLKDTYHEASSYETRWDGTDPSGAPVASGLYFYRLIGPGVAETKKMILVR